MDVGRIKDIDIEVSFDESCQEAIKWFPFFSSTHTDITPNLRISRRNLHSQIHFRWSIYIIHSKNRKPFVPGGSQEHWIQSFYFFKGQAISSNDENNEYKIFNFVQFPEWWKEHTAHNIRCNLINCRIAFYI